MTSEREAKVWMLAAGAMVVWACTMVGCSASVTAGAVSPVNRPMTTALEPTWSGVPMVTLSSDTVHQPIDGVSQPSAGQRDSAGVFAPSRPDVILMQPRPARSPRFDVELSGLSIAQPLVSAKRLLVAAVTMLPPVPTPQWAVASSAAAHADLADQPVAAATGMVQRLAYDRPASDGAAGLGLAMLDRDAVMLAPWQSDPTPTPTVAAAMTADEAKFDAAGIAATIVGAMVLLFGGEAVVLWMLHRRREQARAVMAQTAPADDTEEASIFRFPEPVAAEIDKAYSRAA